MGMVVVVVMMMEDVITQNSKNATALEKKGMMSCGEGYNLCSVKKEKKRVELYFVCTKFIFMRMDECFIRSDCTPLSLDAIVDCMRYGTICNSGAKVKENLR